MSERSVLWPMALTICLSVVIAVLTLSPPLQDDGLPPGADKFYHGVAFLALAVPLASARPRWVAALFVLLTAYGAAIEVAQPFVGRSRELVDLVADIIGIACGILLGLLAGRVIPRPFGVRRAGVVPGNHPTDPADTPGPK